MNRTTEAWIMMATKRAWMAAIAAMGLAGCGVTVTSGGGQGGGASASGATTGSGPATQGAAWDGKGFVVHEWGTDTVVVGSDGSLQRGLHHEEEDLPGFVYDRIRAGGLAGSASVEVKMETPVTYFYSDAPRAVHVNVAFPQGVFSQWYPAVAQFYPFVVPPGAGTPVTQLSDPALDPAFPFGQPTCAAKYGAIADGFLDWGTVQVLGRGAPIAPPEAPLDKFTWSFARQVDANAVRVAGVPGAMEAAQDERFLFYRGVGRFDVPLHVTAQKGGALTLANPLAEAVGTTFVLNVGKDRAAFVAYPGGVGAGAELAAKTPSLDDGEPLDAFVEALGHDVTDALAGGGTYPGTGLFHDEAVAMVETWKRQWFRTPGVRLLYLVPQAWTDASIPLTIDPKPDHVTRVMMIRVEVISPELEEADVAAAAKLASASTTAAGEKHFLDLGRFAEPRLRRALALLGEPAFAQPFLQSIATVDVTHASGE